MPLGGARVISTPPHYAYLKIAEGCNNGCYYCAIPLIRGGLRSRANERDLYGQYSTLEDYVKVLLSYIEEEKL